jgi:5'-phosphate synthase pdxT subunit
VKIGVLALQGDVREHLTILSAIGVEALEVRSGDELDEVDALVLPGGESTTIGRLATVYGLIDPLRARLESGMPALGTCAGLILLASSTVGAEQPQLGALDVMVRRNAFGRQVDSFEQDLSIEAWSRPLHAVFIRAPWIEKVGSEVEVLAAVLDPHDGTARPVFVRQGQIMATSFHPELTGDTRVHRMLVESIPPSEER